MNISFSAYLTYSFFSFAKHFLGTIIKPYETYRDLVNRAYFSESLFIALLIFAYIGLASVLRKGLAGGPLFLTLHFGKLSWGIFSTFVFAWAALYFIGKLFGGKGTPFTIFLPWVYSLIPTFFWFIATSFFYYFLPPPRSNSILGQIFSFVFTALSLIFFYWKGVLYYLTLRFGHKLDLFRILLVSLIVFPLGILYSLLTYKLGIFRIPFI